MFYCDSELNRKTTGDYVQKFFLFQSFSVTFVFNSESLLLLRLLLRHKGKPLGIFNKPCINQKDQNKANRQIAKQYKQV